MVDGVNMFTVDLGGSDLSRDGCYLQYSVFFKDFSLITQLSFPNVFWMLQLLKVISFMISSWSAKEQDFKNFLDLSAVVMQT